MTNIIELKDAERYYEMGENIVKALDGVDISVCKGDFIAIMGPSGSGKSTSMNLTGSLDLATKENYLDGEILQEWKNLSWPKLEVKNWFYFPAV